MNVPFTILTPPEPPASPGRLHHVHLFHVIRSTFGVIAGSAPEAIQAAMPLYDGVDFTCENPEATQGYLSTYGTDKIASVLVEEQPKPPTGQVALPEAGEEPITPEMQILHLASALVQITAEDTADGRFCKIAQDALTAAGITVVDEPES